MKCPKCGYERQASDDAPDWQCPSCKVAYIKALQAQERDKAASAAADTSHKAEETASSVKESGPTLDTVSRDLPPLASVPPTRVIAEQDVVDDEEESESDEHHWLAAQGQKMVIYSIIFNFILNAAQRSEVLSGYFLSFLFFCVGAYSILGILKICSGLDKSRNQKILYMVLSFFPLINVVVMIYLSIKTSRMLRDAGWTVGLLGARP